jgi:bile acid:Na+ symporter, BASS family
MKALLPIAVFLLMVSVGMSLKPGELLRHQARLRGWPWLRLLIATFLVPPLVVLIMVRFLPIDFGEQIGLFILAVIPGAPLMSHNAAKRGFDLQLAASYQVWGAILTPVMIPLVVFGAAKLYNRTVWIPPRMLLLQIAENQFLPLLLGLALAYFAASFARKIQPAITAAGNGLLLLILVVLLWAMRHALAEITPWIVVAAVILAVCSMAAIPLLLRADSDINKTLALCNANRHVGLALLLAGDYLHARNALPAIACYALVGPLSMFVYARAIRRSRATAASA